MKRRRKRLVNTLANQIATAYTEQITDKSDPLDGGVGTGYLTELCFDAWRGLPVKPADPIPYVKTIVGHAISLEPIPAIVNMPTKGRDALYRQVYSRVWEIIKEQD